jgi:polysaccharide pyruvyl transferase WcaK-like protein
LDPKLNTFKISYAPSANLTDIEQIDTNTRNLLSEYISNFDQISVRDNHSFEMVQKLGINDVTKVPDPTLTTDIPKQNTDQMLAENGVDTDGLILGLHVRDSPFIEKLVSKYESMGYQIVSPMDSRYSHIDLYGQPTPFQYFSLYSEFDKVITSSLHSTIFSIKSKTPFVTIDSYPGYEYLESKTYSLLDDFGMLDRHIDMVNKPVNVDTIQNRLETPLNSQHVLNMESVFRKTGTEYLERSLSEVTIQ